MVDSGAGQMVLVGLMGSGKTSVARLLARALRRPLRDSDDDLEARYGATAAEHADRYGAEVLHERERQVLRDALVADTPSVITAAASVVEDPACRAALAPAFVVWLDAPARVLAERMRDGAHRPHYDPDLVAMLSTQYDRRAPGFREVADLTVDVTGPGPEEVADTILASLDSRATRRPQT